MKLYLFRYLFILLLVLSLTAGLTAQDDPIVVPPTEGIQVNVALTQTAYQKASNTDAYDLFSSSAALDGDTLVVGAPYEAGNGSSPDDNSLNNAGAVYVFIRQGETWVQQAYLKADSPDAEDCFGMSVALDGDTLVVGAPYEAGDGSSPDDNSLRSAGAAYVFVRQGETWVQQAYLKASNPDADDFFGDSVAVDDDTLAVGANWEAGNGSSPDDNSLRGAGAAYVFVRENGRWVQQTYLKASNPDADDFFGSSVALDGDTLAVGASWEAGNGSSPNDNSMSRAGAAYVFVRQNGRWMQQAYLKADTPDFGDDFGMSVALDGDTLVVGAPGDDGGGSIPDYIWLNSTGAAYVFVRKNGSWVQQAYLKASNPDEEDYFGSSVALDGDTLVVGASAEAGNGSSLNDNSLPWAGAGYMFMRQGECWVQQAYLKAGNPDEGDIFGMSVAVDSDTLVIGANWEAGNGSSPNDNSQLGSGAAYVFDLSDLPLEWMAPPGNITTIGNPTYQWTEVDGATGYTLYVGPTDGYVPAVFYGIVPASVCSDGVCSVDLTTQTPLIPGAVGWIVSPGSYVVFINPDPINPATWLGPYEFTTTSPQPAVPTMGATTGLDTPRPTLNWTLEGNAAYAAFFQLYLAPSDDLANTVIPAVTWVTREQACGTWESTTCSYTVPNALESGREYSLYMRSWGMGGFSTGGLGGAADGWIEYKFTTE